MNEGQPTKRDWELLFSLAGSGAAECPWAWEIGTNWPPEWDSRDYEALIRRCLVQAHLEEKL